MGEHSFLFKTLYYLLIFDPFNWHLIFFILCFGTINWHHLEFDIFYIDICFNWYLLWESWYLISLFYFTWFRSSIILFLVSFLLIGILFSFGVLSLMCCLIWFLLISHLCVDLIFPQSCVDLDFDIIWTTDRKSVV